MKVKDLIEVLQKKHSPDDDVYVIVAEKKKGFPVSVLEMDNKFAFALAKVSKTFGDSNG